MLTYRRAGRSVVGSGRHPAHGGTEDFFSSPFGEAIGGLMTCFRLGGYMIESNQGHIGDEIDEKGGKTPRFTATAPARRWRDSPNS